MDPLISVTPLGPSLDPGSTLVFGRAVTVRLWSAFPGYASSRIGLWPTFTP